MITWDGGHRPFPRHPVTTRHQQAVPPAATQSTLLSTEAQRTFWPPQVQHKDIFHPARVHRRTCWTVGRPETLRDYKKADFMKSPGWKWLHCLEQVQVLLLAARRWVKIGAFKPNEMETRNSGVLRFFFLGVMTGACSYRKLLSDGVMLPHANRSCIFYPKVFLKACFPTVLFFLYYSSWQSFFFFFFAFYELNALFNFF